VIELSDIPLYPDQLIKLSGARILMGVHGAGMSNMIWMLPEKGGVIEVMVQAFSVAPPTLHLPRTAYNFTDLSLLFLTDLLVQQALSTSIF
jgi:hypothetical protein